MELFAGVVAAAATAILAWFTYRLAFHTKALTLLTERLIALEHARDVREQRDKRISEVRSALSALEGLRRIPPNDFVQGLASPWIIPEPASTYVRQLALLARHIEDPDSIQYLAELRQVIDTVERGGAIGGTGPDVARKFKLIQDRMTWSLTKWRDELAAAV